MVAVPRGSAVVVFKSFHFLEKIPLYVCMYMYMYVIGLSCVKTYFCFCFDIVFCIDVGCICYVLLHLLLYCFHSLL